MCGFFLLVPAGQKRELPGAVLLSPPDSGLGSLAAGLHLQGQLSKMTIKMTRCSSLQEAVLVAAVV